MILDDIVAYKKQELEEAKKKLPLRELLSAAVDTPPAIDFLDLHAKTPGVKIISEIKKASPSKGVIRDDFDHFSIAREYEASGAFALSVLTDRKFFGGDISYLSDIRAHSELPILRKDFTIDPYQVYEARCHGGRPGAFNSCRFGPRRNRGISFSRAFPRDELHRRGSRREGA